MDTTRKYDNPSPEGRANLLSRIFFCWTFPLLYYGYKNDLETKHLYNTRPQDHSEVLGNVLEKNWIKELTRAKEANKTPSLGKAIVMTYYKPYIFCGVAHLIIATVLRMFQPLILAEFIRYFDVASPHIESKKWLLGASVVTLSFIVTILTHNIFMYSFRIGMWCRIAICSLMYRKLLKLNKTSLSKTAAGQIVNLMSNDVQRFDIAAGYLHFIWIMPIQAIVAASVMYNSVGYSALVGFVVLLIQVLALQGYLSKLQGKLRSKIATRTDSRIKLMSEIILGIQVIKMYAWEKPFKEMVQFYRKLELKALTTTSYVRGITTALKVLTQRFTLYITLISYVLMGYPLTSDKVFSLSQFFNIIRFYISSLFPQGLALLAESKVSIRRIQEFLLLDEVQEASPHSNQIIAEEKGSIKIKNVKASWKANSAIDTLSNITLNIKPGTLTAIVGTVGSGKTSLLQLILNELSPSDGSIEVNGEISYSSQEPWLFTSNVQNNILFGQTFVKSIYNQVVRVCALLVDFDQLPQGDKTLVGERGVSLSGGQRARINLARAIYRKADIYIMDDPVSAVDTHVANDLFRTCILGYLKEKTRILITHQLQFLKHADQIVVMNNGQIEKVTTFEDLLENNLTYLRQDVEDINEDAISTAQEEETGTGKRLISVHSEPSVEQDTNENEEPLETKELIEKGAISVSLYKQYFTAGAPTTVFIFFALLVLISQGFLVADELWLTHWTNVAEARKQPCNNATNDSALLEISFTERTYSINETLTEVANTTNVYALLDNQYYMLLYTFFIAMSIMLVISRAMLFFKLCMRASKRLHNTLFANFQQATMRFFDTNPSGRILNRFSKDMGTIDEYIPQAMFDTIQIFSVLLGTIMMIWFLVPWVFIPTLVLGMLFLFLRTIYLRTAQDIKRLEGIIKAPIFSHVSASLYGLTTIRSFKAQHMVAQEFDALQNGHTSAWYLHIVMLQAFGLYLDIICVIFLATLTLQYLLLDEENAIPGNVGLVISQALTLLGTLQFGVRQTAEVASQMTSVERVLQYSKIEKEEPFESASTRRPHRDWPKLGALCFENLYLKYAVEKEPVLRHLNININPGEKIGIVGRTGAGKSSLINALFRLALFDGHIYIDDIDIVEIGLYDLRTKISVIPQEPILFSTSVRYNLDPYSKSDEQTLWKTLENVGVKEIIETLDQQVVEGGTNFSIGQRQLLCLARAIIKNNKILMLDEATSSVDPQTDAIIQETIRRNFKDCTVLTIAHRLNTIIDSDRIIVIDNGEVVEFDTPHLLLQRNGHFNGMVQATGTAMAAKLREAAKEKYLFQCALSKEEQIHAIINENVKYETNSNESEHTHGIEIREANATKVNKEVE